MSASSCDELLRGRVARSRDDGVAIEQIAADFGIHPMTLSKWMRQADVDEGTKAGTSTTDSTELREARRRIKLLEPGRP
jgi:transposase